MGSLHLWKQRGRVMWQACRLWVRPFQVVWLWGLPSIPERYGLPCFLLRQVFTWPRGTQFQFMWYPHLHAFYGLPLLMVSPSLFPHLGILGSPSRWTSVPTSWAQTPPLESPEEDTEPWFHSYPRGSLGGWESWCLRMSAPYMAGIPQTWFSSTLSCAA